MREDDFVKIAMAAAEEVLGGTLSIERGKSLLYQVTVDNRLDLAVDPKSPKRGQSAFQTDLCVFEKVDGDVKIPRVVLEFKAKLSTHDVLTYTTKARKHKQVYPYLRYGLIVAEVKTIPGRFFTHNDSLDFCVAAESYGMNRLPELFTNLLSAEVSASRVLEKISFGRIKVDMYRSEIILKKGADKVV